MAVLKYTALAKAKAARVFAVSAFVFVYMARLATCSPPLTLAMTRLAEANPCEISRNASYIAKFCTPDTRSYANWLVCDDGGWEEYTSAEHGCRAAEVFPAVRAKT